MAKGAYFSSRPIEAKSPIVRAIFGIIEQRGTPMLSIALDMEISAQQLWQWRAGKVNPRIDRVEKLCEVLGIDLDVFNPEDTK
ncbi:hypothetical protein [Synechococcus phage Ssp-JY38]|nr:hypothetical protein [Synechococcus phage Yong-L2-223]